MNDKMDMPEEQTPAPKKSSDPGKLKAFLWEIYDLVEVVAMVTVIVMLGFAFLGRLNIVEGQSMDKTLAQGQYLLISDLFYEPTPGDIVVVHDITASPYDEPIVKRVIAVGGQTVEIDFNTWTLKIDGEAVEEPYRFLNPQYSTLRAEYNLDANGVFRVTVPENEIFVMGDNRNASGDSRQKELGTIDKRCVVGKAYVRLFPLADFGILE